MRSDRNNYSDIYAVIGCEVVIYDFHANKRYETKFRIDVDADR